VSALALREHQRSNVKTGPEPNPRLVLWSVVLFCSALFIITLTGLPQFMDNEWRLSAYVLDMLQNGRWFCPTDANGDVISKPPMLAWLAALGALATGGVNAFALYWPTAAATTATAALLLVYGRKYFGWRTGLLAAMTYVASYVGLSQMSMSRYDGLLALPVTAGALAAFSAWQTGMGWTSFWVFAALGTLVKGPLAVVLPSFGLLAHFGERYSAKGQIGVRVGSQVPGLVLFFVITGGWFALAYSEMGPPLLKKMLGRELVAHAVEGTASPLSGFAEPTKFFLGIYAPWSLIALAGFWRIIRSPSPDTVQRRLERFLLLWFVFGLVLFSVAAHQRGRLIYPLVPAAALVAGLQLSRWTVRMCPRTLLVGSGSLAAIFLAGSFFYTHVIIANSRRVQETLAMKALAERLQRSGAGEFPLTYVRTPLALQVWMNTRRPEVSVTDAATLLAGPEPAFVVTKEAQRLRSAVMMGQPIYEVFTWTSGRSTIHILSNRPGFEEVPHAKMSTRQSG
jgi:4-amino-4-deoxy-L-arabinose transferase-like glycosyltransferase